MKLTLHHSVGLPGQPETQARVVGNTLIYNEERFDLSSIPEGGEGVPQGDHPFVGIIYRNNGEIEAGIKWIYPGADYANVQPETPPVVQLNSGVVPNMLRKKE